MSRFNMNLVVVNEAAPPSQQAGAAGAPSISSMFSRAIWLEVESRSDMTEP
jgi:hypothetical protein